MYHNVQVKPDKGFITLHYRENGVVYKTVVVEAVNYNEEMHGKKPANFDAAENTRKFHDQRAYGNRVPFIEVVFFDGIGYADGYLFYRAEGVNNPARIEVHIPVGQMNSKTFSEHVRDNPDKAVQKYAVYMLENQVHIRVPRDDS